MSKPLIIVIPHELGQTAARERLETGLARLKAAFQDKVSGVDERWTDNHLDLAIRALGQSISAGLDVGEKDVRIEVQLPWLLAAIADKARTYLEREGRLMLERK
ncbi:MAG: polyhydroxyalkanoic acid system family protein [Methylobacteriaceae bacterium]|nr:polyhydroxyalkanoic acid system family protein [Methylobacteriaceae bacterium]